MTSLDILEGYRSGWRGFDLTGGVPYKVFTIKRPENLPDDCYMKEYPLSFPPTPGTNNAYWAEITFKLKSDAVAFEEHHPCYWKSWT